MAFVKDIINGVIKKLAIFERFYNNQDNNLDYKTRIDEYEIDDMSFLHVLHEYWEKNWDYDSPLYDYLQRKKALRVSRDGMGRSEMQNILRTDLEKEEEKRTNWDKLMGTP